MHTHRNTYAYMCTYKCTPEEAGEHMALAYKFWRKNTWIQIQFSYLLSQAQYEL